VRIPFVAFVVVVLLGGHAIAQSDTQSSQATSVAGALDRYIVPAYEKLDAVTDGLSAALAQFCASPNDADRQAVAAAFADTIHAWAAVDFFRFGPMTEDGRYERFAFFPDVHGTGARQLRRFLADENLALLEPSAMAAQSAAVQGLPALESLLYSGPKALLEAPRPESYRCALAKAVATNVASIAEAALLRWTQDRGWAELLKNPSANNPVYRTDSEAMTEILKAILTAIEQLREHRLMAALGETPEQGTASRASRAPYNASGLALFYLAASAEALARFIEASRVLGLVPEQEKWIIGSIEFELRNLQRAITAAGADLEAALANPEKREKLVYAAVVLASLRDLFQNRLGPAVGISGGFNSIDGD